MDTFLYYENDGQKIASTNFWGTVGNAKNLFVLSTNAGGLRLLIPDGSLNVLEEIWEAKRVVITRGPHPRIENEFGLELMFEEEANTPYVIQLGVFDTDVMIPESKDTLQYPVTIWVNGGGGKAILVREFHGYFRRTSKRLPCQLPLHADPKSNCGRDIPLASSFNHYTLQTGEIVPSLRWQCEEFWLKVGREVLGAAGSTRQIVPVLSRGSESLHFIDGPDDGFAVSIALGEISDDPGFFPLATWVTAWDDKASDLAWGAFLKCRKLVLDHAGIAPSVLSVLDAACVTPFVKPKITPWCADYTFPFLANAPELSPALDEFKRAVVWAQLERAGYTIDVERDRN